MEKPLLAFAFIQCVLISVVSAEDQSAEEYRQAQLARMQQIGRRFQFGMADSATKSEIKLGDKPLLRYNDSTRRLDESTLWLWTERERPIGLMAVEFYPKERNAPRWLFEIVSLSDSAISVTRDGDWKWQAKQPGVVRHSLPGDLTPGDKPAQRLTQARQIRQRFTAYEKANIGGRIELRPLSNPLYRYADEESGVIDGAIFAFANGTNPEVLLLLEAQRNLATKETFWSYGFAQMTGAEVYVSLDDQEVWSRPNADPPASRDSYVNGWLTETSDENSNKAK